MCSSLAVTALGKRFKSIAHSAVISLFFFAKDSKKKKPEEAVLRRV